MSQTGVCCHAGYVRLYFVQLSLTTVSVGLQVFSQIKVFDK